MQINEVLQFLSTNEERKNDLKGDKVETENDEMCNKVRDILK